MGDGDDKEGQRGGNGARIKKGGKDWEEKACLRKRVK